MLQLNLLLLLGLLLLSACGVDQPADSVNRAPVVRTDDRPNIVFIYTDDQGYADIGANEVVEDILTPNIDKLAQTGVRMTNGYVTAPQCTPSRAALMSGRYQQKFGVDDNRFTPFPLDQTTLAEKLSDAGYVTGMVGKWHLEINANSDHWYREVYRPGTENGFDVSEIPEAEKIKYFPESRGFEDTFFGYTGKYRANFNLQGDSIKLKTLKDSRFRVDVASDAAISFIDRHKESPFFLYLAYFAPHVPLEASEKYLDRFKGEMPERRRYALAMMSAVDDGVGRILGVLEQYGIDDDTIVFFISDNGAPLALNKEDFAPVSEGGPYWDGSLNDPWVGEKGMLAEGGIRVPYIVRWKGHLPAGRIYDEPVITLDAATTAAALAGIETSDFDGIDLIPLLRNTGNYPDRALYWRFLQQAAIRKGKWKYLIAGNHGEYLFDLQSEQHESRNLLDDNPDIAGMLKQQLGEWAETLERPGLPNRSLGPAESLWYDFYLPE